MAGEREVIPDDATVNRLIDFPRMGTTEGLIWENVFEFPGGLGESVAWSKYAPLPEDVHALGCEREAAKRQSKPEMRYGGFIPAIVGAVRNIKSKRGHGFKVEHEPEEGDHHAEIGYLQAAAAEFQKADKAELKYALKQVFGALVAYSCPNI